MNKHGKVLEKLISKYENAEIEVENSVIRDLEGDRQAVILWLKKED